MSATFDKFFRAATATQSNPEGNAPYDYQRRLAGAANSEGPAPGGTFPCKSQLISIPTGLGKTAAVVLAWLWNRVHLKRDDWPRRLVICLPMSDLSPRIGSWRLFAGNGIRHLHSIERYASSACRFRQRGWQRERYCIQGKLAVHRSTVCGELDTILKDTGIACAALPIAARWHDFGKAHEAFQAKIRLDHRLSADGTANTPIAKAPDGAWKQHRERDAEGETQKKRRHFRHELASALTVLQPGVGGIGIPAELRNLVAWLIAAHHGKVRLSIRSMPDEDVAQSGKRFARGVWDGDLLPAVSLGAGILSPSVRLSLEPMELGLCAEEPFEHQPSWAERMLALRDNKDVGPLRLAYWETLLRAADERASAKNRRTILA